MLHIRNREGKANTRRGAELFVEELLARVRRAGNTGPIVLPPMAPRASIRVLCASVIVASH